MTTEKAPLEACLPPKGSSADELLDAFLTYTESQGLELYEAQEEAILELFSGKNVILATPTGSGKSLVALAFAFKALAEDKVTFYTAPIKALVNEKFFDLCRALGPKNVGLMTGDASVNADAPVICATAEILASVALRGGSRADVDHVVMDEFHFYSERERGVAWQIPLLELPQSRFLLMSATLGDTKFFEDTMSDLTGAETALVKTDQRPVPLHFSYQEVPLHETIDDLLKDDKAPVYIVHFTQRDTAEHAQALMSLKLIEKDEKKAIAEAMRDTRFDSPFGKELKRWLSHGVGVHHAGMLPKYRRLVERLAQKGMLKLICGTDTLGVGVNVPIRSVLFTKLCKYNGEKTSVLTVRHFKQIAGRAGRRGYDDEGFVYAQAPEHEIENRVMRLKAGDDKKKQRKLKLRKPPERGYAHWDEAKYTSLIEGESEPLRSRFMVSHGLILSLLARQDEPDAKPKEGCNAIKSLIKSSHESKVKQRRHGLRAIQMLRSLHGAGVVEMSDIGPRIAGELQQDFAMNQPLGPYVVEVIEVLDKESEDYALDVVSVIEATLEDPNAVLRRQLDTIRGRAIGEMKAEGIEYDERMAKLEEIDRPKPKSDLLYATYETFREHHPWVGSESIRPKSIVRDMYELGMNFNEYVKEYGLGRSEGVLLRHLSNAYKSLLHTVPEPDKTDELLDLIEWLELVVTSVDASLMNEWEALSDPEAAAKKMAEQEDAKDEVVDITRNKRAFQVMVRNAVWQVVRALARKNAEGASALFVECKGEQLQPGVDAYFETYDAILLDPEARAAKHSLVTQGDSEWSVEQILCDPEDHHGWRLNATVSLEESREAGAPVLHFVSLSE